MNIKQNEVADTGVSIASTECEPIMGVLGLSPQQDPAADAPGRGIKGQSPPPLKLKAIQSLKIHRKHQICSFSIFFNAYAIGPTKGR